MATVINEQTLRIDSRIDGISEGQRLGSSKKPRDLSEDVQGDIVSDGTDEAGPLSEGIGPRICQESLRRTMHVPAECGIIESITCTNFMCHTFLEVSLGPLINFVIGHNGSGKSALLTAITICLGGKATATNRGGSLKNFIKNGEESAVLSIKLKNGSDGAYQHDIYGESIIVERLFSRSGNSTFKIKSSAGKVISTRKSDLEDICDFFALQIDNPMNVLTQDMARQFLNNSTSYDKYKFFMKGTQLEHLDSDYLIVEQNVQMIDDDLIKKAEDLEIFRKQARTTEDLYRQSQRNDETRQRIVHLHNMAAWAQVEVQESLLRRFDRRLIEEEDVIQALRTRSTSLSEAFSQSNDACNAAIRTFEDACTALNPLNDAMERMRGEHDSLRSEQIDIQAQQRDIGGEIRGTDARISRITGEIHQEKIRLSASDGGRHAERRNEIEEKGHNAQMAKSRLENHEDNLMALQESRNQAQQECLTTQQQQKEKRKALRVAEERLVSLERDRGKQQNAYPSTMSQLLQDIEHDSGFHEKPVGPLGSHVRLLKPMWSSILEKSFGAALDAFIVTSKPDQIRLAGLMSRVKCITPILIGNHGTIDTTEHEPDAAFDTWLRVLEIDNDLVRKQLVIGQSIDQTILISDRKAAVDAMDAGRLNNVKQCFSHNERPGSGLRIAQSQGGGLSQTYIAPFAGIPRMKTDIEYQINFQRGIVERSQRDVHYIDQEFRRKQSQLTKCEQIIGRHHKDTRDLQLEIENIQSTLGRLQDALDEDAVAEGRLEALKRQLVETEDEKSTHEGSYQESVAAKDQLSQDLAAKRQQMAELEKLIEESTAKKSKAETKAAQRKAQREDALREKNGAIEAVATAELHRTTCLEERNNHEVYVDDFTRQASEFCTRVVVEKGETPESLEQKYKKLEKDVERAEGRLGGSQAKLAADAHKALLAFRRAEAEVNSANDLVRLLKTTLENRKQRWRHFRSHIIARARIQFFYLVSERGFRGKLLVNNKEKKLDLQVEPDGAQRYARGHGTHVLSGGERSFSTICLLLAIWEAMGAPIRCLDEFDVFMDSVNRDISMDLLVRFARESGGKQFLLITPQSMSKIASRDTDIRITKMSDPERGQTILDFGTTVAR